MQASDLKAARARLILKRDEIVKGLRSRMGDWRELTEVCRAVSEIDQALALLSQKPEPGPSSPLAKLERELSAVRLDEH